MPLGSAHIQERLSRLFELRVRDEFLRNWTRPEQEAAAVISNRKNLPESIYKPESGLRDWEGQTLLLQGGFVRSALRQIVGNTTPVQVVASNPLPVTGPCDTPMESLHALPLEEHDGSLS